MARVNQRLLRANDGHCFSLRMDVFTANGTLPQFPFPQRRPAAAAAATATVKAL